MTFGDVVKDIYEREHLSLSKMAAAINAVYPDPADQIVNMTVSNWLHGRFVPAMAKIDFLARYAPAGSWVRELGQRGRVALCPNWLPDAVEEGHPAV